MFSITHDHQIETAIARHIQHADAATRLAGCRPEDDGAWRWPIGCATKVTGIIGPTFGSWVITSCAVE